MKPLILAAMIVLVSHPVFAAQDVVTTSPNPSVDVLTTPSRFPNILPCHWECSKDGEICHQNESEPLCVGPVPKPPVEMMTDTIAELPTIVEAIAEYKAAKKMTVDDYCKQKNTCASTKRPDAFVMKYDDLDYVESFFFSCSKKHSFELCRESYLITHPEVERR